MGSSSLQEEVSLCSCVVSLGAAEYGARAGARLEEEEEEAAEAEAEEEEANGLLLRGLSGELSVSSCAAEGGG